LVSERRQAVWLEQFSIIWMIAEAGVAVTAGIISGSVALTSFGFDSVIELISPVLVLRRSRAELAGQEAGQDAERRVLPVIAVTFFALAVYVVVSSAVGLATGVRPERSLAGIGLTCASLLVMPLLGGRKRHVARSCAVGWSWPMRPKRSCVRPSRPRP
jgi:divalent metal cation (Fe/Co/Zn/Cd) transporter